MSEEQPFLKANPTDEELMARFQEEDGKAFDALYRRYHVRLRAFFISVGHTQDAAEDLTQDTFLKVLEAKGQYNPEIGCFAQWLFGIAHNQRLGLFRRFSYTTKLLIRMATNAIGEKLPAPLFDERFLAEQYLSELSDVDRTIVELTVFQGFTLLEVAKILGMPPGTVGRRKREAIVKLRGMLSFQPGRSR